MSSFEAQNCEFLLDILTALEQSDNLSIANQLKLYLTFIFSLSRKTVNDGEKSLSIQR